MGGGGSSEPKETADERAFAEIAAQQQIRYEETFQPFEREAIGRALSLEDDMQFQDIASTEMARSFGGTAEAAAVAPAQAAGYGSGRQIMSIREQGEDQARATGAGLFQAQMAADDRYAAALEQMVGYGQGRADTAVSGLGELATQANRRAAADAQAAQQARAAALNAAGTVAGAGAAYYMPAPQMGGRTLQSAGPAPRVTGSYYQDVMGG